MATVKAGDIIDRAAITLFDETAVRWTPAELLEYLSDGQREVVSLKPSANPVNEVVQFAAGTKQTIPSAGITLIDVVRSMGDDGETPGRAVRAVIRQTLDATRPDWHTEDAAIVPKHYMFDDRDPRTYYLTPPQPVTPGYGEIVYSKAPVEITDVDTTIELDDIYAPVLYYYVMARALAKQSGEGDPQGATTYYNMFVGGVTGRTEASRRLHPLQEAERAVK